VFASGDCAAYPVGENWNCAKDVPLYDPKPVTGDELQIAGPKGMLSVKGLQFLDYEHPDRRVVSFVLLHLIGDEAMSVIIEGGGYGHDLPHRSLPRSLESKGTAAGGYPQVRHQLGAANRTAAIDNTQ